MGYLLPALSGIATGLNEGITKTSPAWFNAQQAAQDKGVADAKRDTEIAEYGKAHAPVDPNQYLGTIKDDAVREQVKGIMTSHGLLDKNGMTSYANISKTADIINSDAYKSQLLDTKRMSLMSQISGVQNNLAQMVNKKGKVAAGAQGPVNNLTSQLEGLQRELKAVEAKLGYSDSTYTPVDTAEGVYAFDKSDPTKRVRIGSLPTRSGSGGGGLDIGDIIKIRQDATKYARDYATKKFASKYKNAYSRDMMGNEVFMVKRDNSKPSSAENQREAFGYEVDALLAQDMEEGQKQYYASIGMPWLKPASAPRIPADGTVGFFPDKAPVGGQAHPKGKAGAVPLADQVFNYNRR